MICKPFCIFLLRVLYRLLGLGTTPAPSRGYSYSVSYAIHDVCGRMDGWLLMTIMRHIDHATNRLEVSIEQLAQLADMGRGSVITYTGKLEEKGLLTVKRSRERGQQIADMNVYSLAGVALSALWMPSPSVGLASPRRRFPSPPNGETPESDSLNRFDDDDDIPAHKEQIPQTLGEGRDATGEYDPPEPEAEPVHPEVAAVFPNAAQLQKRIPVQTILRAIALGRAAIERDGGGEVRKYAGRVLANGFYEPEPQPKWKSNRSSAKHFASKREKVDWSRWLNTGLEDEELTPLQPGDDRPEWVLKAMGYSEGEITAAKSQSPFAAAG